MTNINTVRYEVDRLLGNKNIEDLTDDDYNKLIDELFYNRVKDIPSEEATNEITLVNGELLATSSEYKSVPVFDLIDEQRETIVRVMKNRLESDGLEFSLPFNNKHDLDQFIFLLAYLDTITRIKYPADGLEIDI